MSSRPDAITTERLAEIRSYVVMSRRGRSQWTSLELRLTESVEWLAAALADAHAANEALVVKLATERGYSESLISERDTARIERDELLTKDES